MSDNYKKYLREGIIENFTQSVVADSVKANVDFQYNAGLSPKIIRKAAPGCCDWCTSMAGTYDYESALKDIYKRHADCNCTVEYDPGTGKRQNAHTKKWYETDDETLEKWKTIGLKDKLTERGAALEQKIKVRLKTGDMTSKEYVEYKAELEAVKGYEQIILDKKEYAYIISELNTWLTDEERKHAIVYKTIGDYTYKIINKGFNDYLIIGKVKVD